LKTFLQWAFAIETTVAFRYIPTKVCRLRIPVAVPLSFCKSYTLKAPPRRMAAFSEPDQIPLRPIFGGNGAGENKITFGPRVFSHGPSNANKMLTFAC
jgi:hypothetical protein